MGARLEVKDVALRFGGVDALDGVDLGLEPGEVLGLVGPNGSGKTTLLNVVSGLYPPGRGEVLLDGRSIAGLAAARIVRQGVVRTFQNARLFARMTVAENIAGARHAAAPRIEAIWQTRTSRRRDREAVRSVMALLGLEPLAEALPDRLSLAERRRVELARALAADPRLLLLDEPTSGMTPEETESLSRLLAEHVLPGRSAILVEHKLLVVSALCGRVVVLAAGRKLADGAPLPVLSSREVRQAYLGEPAPC